jgi:D-alanine-D-alanine ligase
MRVAVVNNAVGHAGCARSTRCAGSGRFDTRRLIALGHEVETIACGLDLSYRSRNCLKKMGIEIAFNLVEDLEGHGRLIHLVPFVLDALAIPYTGSCAESLLATSNKVMAKERMETAGLPTPEWIGPYQMRDLTLFC